MTDSLTAETDYAINIDPESGWSVWTVTDHERRMAVQFPEQIRIRKVPADLVSRYHENCRVRNAIDNELESIFRSEQSNG